MSAFVILFTPLSFTDTSGSSLVSEANDGLATCSFRQAAKPMAGNETQQAR
ncbi:MAG: hypothetical protein FWE12_03685 [Oscillospiraceae bacterium]|nr:hypothetical protein [Oscillospiraceae bacterium]